MIGVCPLCGDAITVDQLTPSTITCPHCGHALNASVSGKALHLFAAEERSELTDALDKISDEKDPVEKYKALTALEEKYPDAMDVQYALLLHGRLHERNPKRLDFSVIKCFALNPFDQPREHKAESRQALYQDLFHSERLMRLIALDGDREAVMTRYLTDVCLSYIQIFMMGSNRYNNSLFGFRVGSASKQLKQGIENMITNIQNDTLMTDEEKRLLSTALRSAFTRRFGTI